MTVRQSSAVAPRIPETQGYFCITAISGPAANRQDLLGDALALPASNQYGAGQLGEGTYECEVLCDGWNILEGALRVSEVTGSVTAALRTRWLDGSTRQDAPAAAFVVATAQTLTLSNLRGTRKAYLVVTVPAGGSVTFDRAEFNGL